MNPRNSEMPSTMIVRHSPHVRSKLPIRKAIRASNNWVVGHSQGQWSVQSLFVGNEVHKSQVGKLFLKSQYQYGAFKKLHGCQCIISGLAV